MICPFCKFDLLQTGREQLDELGICDSFACRWVHCTVNNDIPRYYCMIVKTDTSNRLLEEEYAIDNLYIIVDGLNQTTKIYKLDSCILLDEIKINRAEWLNHKNLETTLDRLKIVIMFS